MTSRKIPESAVENLVSDLEGKANVANTVTTNTTQTITGQKVFTTELQRKSTDIDVTSKATSVTYNTVVLFRDKNGKGIGAVNNAQTNDGNIWTVLEARNKDNYAPSMGVIAPYEGSTGGFGYAPNTPDNAPANAIVTKDKIANMVTTNTAQTISGVKTFTANTIVKGNGASNGTFTIKNDVTTYGTSAVDLVAATSNGKNQFLVHFQEGNKWCAYFDQDPSTKNITFSLTPCAAVYAPTPAVASNGSDVATTAWVNTKVGGFANTDASNFTATGKQTVVGWGMPDYTAGISFSNNTNYVAPKNGVAMCVVNLGDYDGLSETRIYINNNEVFFIAGTSVGAVRNLIYIPVSKGDIIKIYMKRTTASSLKFYPFKGVN